MRVNDPGPDGIFGNADDGPPFIVWDIPTAPGAASRTITMTVPAIIAVDRALDLTLTRRIAEQLVADDQLPLQLGSRSRHSAEPEPGAVQRQHGHDSGRSRSSASTRRRGAWSSRPSFATSLAIRWRASSRRTRGIDQATGLQRNLNLTLNYQAERTGAWREDNITLFDARVEKRFDFGRSHVTIWRSSSTRSTSRTRTSRRAPTTPSAAGR